MDDHIGDDLLRLVFTACHPVLPAEARVALTLRLLGGLTTSEIARAFLVPEPTIAQRIVRAKRTLAEKKVPFEVPRGEELSVRLASVLEVVYLIFNEGYVASAGELGRADLVSEAIRLARHTVELMPEEHEATGLLALLLLIDARRAARTDPDGVLVPLGEQDRSRWDRALIAEGQALVRRCLRANRPGPYQIQAAINAVHADARRAEDTAWAQIVALYDQLLVFTPTPVVALNRAVAVAELRSAAEALELVDALELGNYHLFHAVRADLLTRLGRFVEADAAYERALALTTNRGELGLLERRRVELAARTRTRVH